MVLDRFFSRILDIFRVESIGQVTSFNIKIYVTLYNETQAFRKNKAEYLKQYRRQQTKCQSRIKRKNTHRIICWLQFFEVKRVKRIRLRMNLLLEWAWIENRFRFTYIDVSFSINPKLATIDNGLRFIITSQLVSQPAAATTGGIKDFALQWTLKMEQFSNSNALTSIVQFHFEAIATKLVFFALIHPTDKIDMIWNILNEHRMNVFMLCGVKSVSFPYGRNRTHTHIVDNCECTIYATKSGQSLNEWKTIAQKPLWFHIKMNHLFRLYLYAKEK